MPTFLTPDKIKSVKVKGDSIKINVKIIPDNMTAKKDIASWCKTGYKMKPCRKLNNGTGKPKAITIHNTSDIKVASGTNAAEQYTRATFNGNMNGVVVHYYVWHSEIWQNLSDEEQGWHAADGSSRRKDHRGGQTGGNVDTIAIECIGSDAESEKTLAKLVAYLCMTYGLDPDYDIYTHNYWMYGGDKKFSNVRKNCPIYILPHWMEFLESVKKYYEPSLNTSESKSLYRVQVGAFSSKSNASKLKDKLVDDGYADAFIMLSDGLYKVQIGAFTVKTNADKLMTELKRKGYSAFIQKGQK